MMLSPRGRGWLSSHGEVPLFQFQPSKNPMKKIFKSKKLTFLSA